jgi:hypothetical protein
MAMLLVSSRQSVSLDDLEIRIFARCDRYSLAAPELRKIDTAFYGSPALAPAQLAQLASELSELHSRYEGERMLQVKRGRNVVSKDPDVERRVLLRLLTGDVLLAKLAQLKAFSAEAAECGASIPGESD